MEYNYVTVPEKSALMSAILLLNFICSDYSHNFLVLAQISARLTLNVVDTIDEIAYCCEKNSIKIRVAFKNISKGCCEKYHLTGGGQALCVITQQCRGSGACFPRKI